MWKPVGNRLRERYFKVLYRLRVSRDGLAVELSKVFCSAIDRISRMSPSSWVRLELDSSLRNLETPGTS